MTRLRLTEMGRRSLTVIVETDSLKDRHHKIEVPGPLNWGYHDTISAKKLLPSEVPRKRHRSKGKTNTVKWPY
jgi:hypothetical protein